VDALPRRLYSFSPSAPTIDLPTSAELDPAVTETARDELAVDLDGIRVLHQEARLALGKLAPGSLDLVIGDVFHDVAVPYHLTTRELATQIRERLGAGGLYAMNPVDAFPDPRLLKSVVATLRQVFRQVDLWMDGPPLANRITFIVTASDAPPLPDEIPARTGPARSWSRVTGHGSRVTGHGYAGPVRATHGQGAGSDGRLRTRGAADRRSADRQRKLDGRWNHSQPRDLPRTQPKGPP